MPGIASAATSIAIAHVAAGDVDHPGRRRRDHAAQPRAAGDRRAVRHARRAPSRADRSRPRARARDRPGHGLRAAPHAGRRPDSFPDDVDELLCYFRPPEPGQRVRAVPGAGADVEVWILGSSLFGAELAGALGLPFAFASHFAPALLMEAVEIYRRAFRPSERLERPRLMLGVNVVAADTRRGGRACCSPRCSRRSSTCAAATPPGCRRRSPGFAERLPPQQAALLDGILACAAIGSPETVRRRLREPGRAHRRRRADPDLADLRPRRAPALVRDRGGAVAIARARRPQASSTSASPRRSFAPSPR